MRKLLLATLLLAWPTYALGQASFNVGKLTTQVKVTISVTNTFQTALAGSGSRSGCLIQNNGTHTMYVFFGSTTPGDTSTSFQLGAGQSISCLASGVVLTDPILITGTANDVAVVASQ